MPSRHVAMIVLLASLALGVCGCKRQTARATPPLVDTIPPAEAAPEPPVAPAEKKLESPLEPTPNPPALVVPPAKPAPAKPTLAPRPAPPQISPRLSPAEEAEAKRRTSQDINAAERNLQSVYGKQLNASQHDLVEKILGFLGQAREAIRASDWARASNLAQKARVLSIELINLL